MESLALRDDFSDFLSISESREPARLWCRVHASIYTDPPANAGFRHETNDDVRMRSQQRSVYWVPVNDASVSSDEHLSIVYDDRKRLETRIRRSSVQSSVSRFS